MEKKISLLNSKMLEIRSFRTLQTVRSRNFLPKSHELYPSRVTKMINYHYQYFVDIIHYSLSFRRRRRLLALQLPALLRESLLGRLPRASKDSHRSIDAKAKGGDVAKRWRRQRRRPLQPFVGQGRCIQRRGVGRLRSLRRGEWDVNFSWKCVKRCGQWSLRNLRMA